MEQFIMLATPHYKFVLKVSDIAYPVHIRRFEIGTCFEASLIMSADSHICTVTKLDIAFDPNDSYGTELMLGFISTLKANYPHITHMALRDTTYIGDRLDLLAYNIALYGKSWYEMVLGAYADYTDAIAVYMSPAAKREWTWTKFWTIIAGTNRFADEKIRENVDMFKRIFDESATWPECIIQMKNVVGDCKFFKTWLEKFIYSYVPEKRDWVINIR